MNIFARVAAVACAVVVVAPSLVRAQAAAPGGPAQGAAAPRTAWGDPDLQGTWTSDRDAGIPFERPAELRDKVVLEGDELADVLEERAIQRADSAPVAGGVTGAGPTHWYENWVGDSPRTSMVVDPPDGRLPAQTDEATVRAAARAAAAAAHGPADSYDDRSLWDRCITRTLPNVIFPTLYNNNIRIVQSPGYVAITHEMIHDTRVVPLDGRAPLSPAVRQYMGDSRGRWEGSTLVVEVTNFTGKTAYRGTSDSLRLIEKYTRVAPDRVRYEVTIDDSRTFLRPWTAALNLTAQSEIFEYACHEGNYAMKHILSGARADDAAARPAGAPTRR